MDQPNQLVEMVTEAQAERIRAHMVEIDGTQLHGIPDDPVQGGEPMENQEDSNFDQDEGRNEHQNQDRNVDQEHAELEAAILRNEQQDAEEPIEDEKCEDGEEAQEEVEVQGQDDDEAEGRDELQDEAEGQNFDEGVDEGQDEHQHQNPNIDMEHAKLEAAIRAIEAAEQYAGEPMENEEYEDEDEYEDEEEEEEEGLEEEVEEDGQDEIEKDQEDEIEEEEKGQDEDDGQDKQEDADMEIIYCPQKKRRFDEPRDDDEPDAGAGPGLAY